MRKQLHACLRPLLGAVAVASLFGSAQAQTFTYSPTDLLIGFRDSGPNDLVANLGPAATLLNAQSTVTLSAFSSDQLTAAFGNLDEISFSIFGDVRSNGNPNGPLNTLWVSKAAPDLNTQSTPWNNQSSFTQGNTASRIDGIANGAVAYGGTILAGPNNTGTAIVMPDSNGGATPSYSVAMGAAGNFGGTFQGNAEATTPIGFATGGTSIRLDLYKLTPGSGPSAFVGYFDLAPNGTLSFTPVPEPSTWALVAVGGLLFVGVQRLRRSA